MNERKPPSHYSVKLAQGGAQSSDDVFLECQINALEFAAQKCVEYANVMRGAHVNTNTSSSEIRKLILAEAEKLKHPPLKRR